ncbi:MAG: hypothetical protein ACO1N3_00265 [Gammaproteobacteria bacterium]
MSEQKPNSPEWDEIKHEIVGHAKSLFTSLKKGANKLIEVASQKYGNKAGEEQKPAESGRPKAENGAPERPNEIPPVPKEMPKNPQELPQQPQEVPPPVTPYEPEMKTPSETGTDSKTKTDSENNK